MLRECFSKRCGIDILPSSVPQLPRSVLLCVLLFSVKLLYVPLCPLSLIDFYSYLLFIFSSIFFSQFIQTLISLTNVTVPNSSMWMYSPSLALLCCTAMLCWTTFQITLCVALNICWPFGCWCYASKNCGSCFQVVSSHGSAMLGIGLMLLWYDYYYEEAKEQAACSSM